MVFSSHLFIFYYLPLALAAYYLLPRWGKHLGLTLFSYLFYGWANPYFVFLMFGSTLVDYVCGLVIVGQLGANAGKPIERLEKGGQRTGRQKTAAFISILSNLSLLGFFKYFNFGLENYNWLMQGLGMHSAVWDTVFRVTLPLGISFYTFQSMSYTIDVYRGDAKAMKNFIDFACYVSMFPQLVAGPIIRFSEIADQLVSRTCTLEKFARGVSFFCLGMAKKVILANPCGKVADTVFDAGSAHVLDAWYAVVAYAFQIYFDFSGYSDMAIGLGLMLGFVFPKNFDSPYISKSITEFWRRWHISLSSWLRDYLYIPLGGNRKGDKRTYVNLATVMVLGGLWHGASWNFVIWGMIHGGWLGLERVMGKESFYRSLPGPVKVVITFLIVLISWVFFRASDLPSAVAYLKAMLGLAEVQAGAVLLGGIIYKPYYLIVMALSAVIVWRMPQTWDWTRQLTWPKVIACIASFWLACILLVSQAYNPFIYFIF
ncbi:MAG: MBOAT family protein [Planctomycetota bacterium]|nr:MBOAT family protein [Planctomycetota bacterium]